MEINDPVQVSLPQWQWMFLLGWLRAHIAAMETQQAKGIMQEIADGIASNVQP